MMVRIASLTLLAVHAAFVTGRRVGFAVPSRVAFNRLCLSLPSCTVASRRMCPKKAASHACHANDDDDDGGCASDKSRRTILTSLPLGLGFGLGGFTPKPAYANLVQFPCEDGTLMNTYHLMRAGESLLEADDILGTNPLFITNRDAALSERGVRQVQEACRDMMARGINPSVVNYSLAAKCIDTANLVATEMTVGRNRIVPEYVLMDPRGAGKWDMHSLSLTEPAIWAMDVMEAGAEGLKGRPPPHDDGTPNETLSNQVTRLRQLMSVLETLYSGDSILLIFPDGTGPALLSALLGGIPINRVHELDFSPGEIRYDVTMGNALKMLPAEPSPAYLEKINRGRERLQFLRDHPDEVLNMKEERLREEMMAAEVQRVDMEKAREEAKRERQAALAAEQEQRRAAERERMQIIEAERQSRREELGVVKDTSSEARGHLPDFVSLASLAFVAFMASLRGKDVPRLADDINSYTDESLPGGDEDSRIWARGVQVANSNSREQPDNSPELQAMEDRIQKAPIDIPEFMSIDELKKSQLNGPGRVKVTADKEEMVLGNGFHGELDHNLVHDKSSDEYRTELARNAMEEYMNRDDGGDAWLNMISDMIEDES